MTAERWHRIQEVFHRAAACDAQSRDAWLARETAGDDDLRSEVEKMLRHASGSGPLDHPAWDGSPLEEGPTVGSHLGPYELVEEAGAGGMGRVYKARDTRLGRTVAVKVLSAEFSHRFQTEARAISALNHAHVCALYDIGEQDGMAYLVMEYVEGESLAAHLRRGPLLPDEVLLYGSQIADALAAAHRLGIVHRDLKPANIMITAPGAKVLDFGVAQMAADAAAGTESADPPVMGTLAYMSPSQVNGNPADPRSDIFSLGLVLYEMATGRRHSSGPAGMRPQPAPLAELIDGCLRESAAGRIQSMEEVRFALERMRHSPRHAGVRGIQAAWLAALLVTMTAGGVLVWKVTHPAATPATMAAAPKPVTPSPEKKAQSVPAGESAQPTPSPVVQRVAYGPPALQPAPISLARLTSYPGYVRDTSFSPDGKRIAFAWCGRGRSGYGIYVRGLAEEEPPRALTDGNSQDYGPAWSPDGRTIAFRRGGNHSGIYLVPVSGEAATLLSPIARQGEETLPQMSWSRDGKWIAAPDRDPAGGTQIYLFPTGSGERRKVTGNLTGTDHAPAFSPNGKSMAYASCAAGVSSCEVYIIDLGSDLTPKSQRMITHQPVYIRGITWLADGRGLVYSAGAGMGSPTRLWRVSVKPGSEPERIEMAGSLARHPAVAPRGGLLAFTEFDPGNWHLMVMENFQ